MARGAKLLGVPEAAADLARQLDRALPAVLEALAEEALVEIRPNWPVKSGASRDALAVWSDGGAVAIVCEVKYAPYIHKKGEVGPTYLTRIVQYIQQNIDRLGARVTARLRRA